MHMPSTIRFYSLIPTVEMQSLSEKEGQPAGSISFAHFKTAEWETAALDAYLETARQRQVNSNAPIYAVGIYDCRNFCLSGLHAAGVDYNHYANANISANWIIGILSGSADSSYVGGNKKTRTPDKNSRPDVKTSICFEGQPGCTPNAGGSSQ